MKLPASVVCALTGAGGLVASAVAFTGVADMAMREVAAAASCACMGAGFLYLSHRLKVADRRRLALGRAQASIGALSYDLRSQEWRRCRSLNALLRLEAQGETSGAGAGSFLRGANGQAADFLTWLISEAWRGGTCERCVTFDDGASIWLQVSTQVITDHLGSAQEVIASIQDISACKAAQAEIERLNYDDPLTGLPNRRRIEERVTHALTKAQSAGGWGAVITIGVDGYYSLLETRGHIYSRRLLQEAALRIAAVTHEGWLLGRLEGDEFVIVLDVLSDSKDGATHLATSLAQDVQQCFERACNLNGYESKHAVSVGIAHFNEHTHPAAEIIARSGIAMRRACASGGNATVLWNDALREETERRAIVERDLHEYIAEGRLCLHYQVQVDHTSRPLGAEALLRWEHDDLGMIPPDKFIPIAEEGRLIIEIGKWVLEKACKQLSAWGDDPVLGRLTLAVNVSTRQLSDADFVNFVSLLMERNKVEPHRLKLEITESLMVNDVASVKAKLSDLRRMGVSIALDDFGTGYSSLAIMRKLPLDQIKIDRSFVRGLDADPAAQTMIKSIIELASALGLGVIAEGVETPEQERLLALQGCKFFQGYRFGRPLPLQEFEQLARRLSHVRSRETAALAPLLTTDLQGA